VRVLVVRHAEAASGEPDELRALTPAGREQARQVGRQLATAGVATVLTSPLLRARETADAIGRAVGVEPEVEGLLAPGATLTDFVAAVADRADPVVVVGHQPDCGRIVAELTGRDAPSFPPGGFAEVTL
jgi:phosphohistidine phosphatase